MFTSSRRSRGGVRWLEPGRRRRRRLPLVPLAILLLLLAAAGAVGYVLRERAQDHAELRDTAVRFASAWERRDAAGMYRELDADARSKYSARRFAADYRMADSEATVQRVVVGRVSEEKGGRVTMPVTVRTKLFGDLRGRISLPVTRVGERVGVRWRPYLRLPGLRPGERVDRRVRATPRRASVLAADGRRLDREPTAAALAGEPPVAGEPGSGLERAYNDRLAGRPSAELRFGSRVIASTKARRGRSVRATIRPGLQRAAVSALGDRLGGVAVVRPRDGAVLALSGLATASPQPPGSTFKIVTLAAALQAKVTSPSESFPVRTAATLSGRAAAQRGRRVLRRLAEQLVRALVQLRVRPAGRRGRPQADGGGGRALRLQQAAARAGRGRRAASRATSRTTSRSAPPRSARSATSPRRCSMAAVGATIANRGVHASPRIVRSDRVIRKRAVPRRVATQVRDMMLAVVAGGTGVNARVPGVEVAGKTGTAELRPTADGPQDPKNTDAWFVAFAPARSPEVAVAVMLVGQGQGGTTAAPIAREVLQAALY